IHLHVRLVDFRFRGGDRLAVGGEDQGWTATVWGTTDEDAHGAGFLLGRLDLADLVAGRADRRAEGGEKVDRRVPAAGRQHLAVRRENQRDDAGLWCLDPANLLAGIDVEELDRVAGR